MNALYGLRTQIRCIPEYCVHSIHILFRSFSSMLLYSVRVFVRVHIYYG